MEAGDGSQWHSPAGTGQMNFGGTAESVELLGAALGVGVIGQNARKGTVPRKKGLGDPCRIPVVLC